MKIFAKHEETKDLPVHPEFYNLTKEEFATQLEYRMSNWNKQTPSGFMWFIANILLYLLKNIRDNN